MRAARFHGLGTPVSIDEVPDPEPAAGEVVLDVDACGICGSDVHFLEDTPVPAPLPLTLGHEAAGVVRSVGAGVDGWAAGDRAAISLGNGCGTCRVCRSGHINSCPSLVVPGLHADGAFAEAVSVHADALVAVPDDVSLAAAATATDSVATPYHALMCRARLQPGEHVAVFGIGGVGTNVVSLARLAGAQRVVAVDVSATALERASEAGATDTVLIRAGSDPVAQVRELTEGGADLSVDSVGVPDAVSGATRSLVGGGRALLIGVGMAPPQLDLPQGLFSLLELSVIGSFGSHKEDLERVLEMDAEGLLDIDASISHRLTLDEVPRGLEMLRENTGDVQRIVVEISG